MAARLHPAMQSSVTVEYDPPVPDHHGRCGDVGQVGRPVEGLVEPRQLGQHDVLRQ